MFTLLACLSLVINPPVKGAWKLEAVTVNSKPATDAELTDLLKDFGGIEREMLYKFRKPRPGDDPQCILNDVEATYDLSPETGELIVSREDARGEHSLAFDLRAAGEKITLRFKARGRVVVLTFLPVP